MLEPPGGCVTNLRARRLRDSLSDQQIWDVVGFTEAMRLLPPQTDVRWRARSGIAALVFLSSLPVCRLECGKEAGLVG